MSLTIESLFTIGGVPNSALTPTFKLWEVAGTTKTLALNNISMVNGGDGYYLYEYTVGYDPTKTYTVLVDGGVALPPNERWQTMLYEPLNATLSPTNIADIVDAVWDEQATDHLTAGSTGEYLNEIKADTTQIILNVVTLMNWVDELLKYERNRTKIDKITKTLTVYDDDGITPFKVFYLRDSGGFLSVAEVCERDPV